MADVSLPRENYKLDDVMEFIRLESTLLQSRFDKYDAQIFQVRSWTIAAVGAIGSIAVGTKSLFLAAGMFYPLAFFFMLELFWRRNWRRYVYRYHYLREGLRVGVLKDYAPLDLTHHHGRPERIPLSGNVKGELFTFYFSLGATIFLFYMFAALGYVGGKWG